MSKHSMDLTTGSVLKKLILFSVPLLLTNLLQQLYHSADVIVVGNFAQDPTASLAAVGSTGSITTLFLNLFIGLSVGTNVVCANHYGAHRYEPLRRAMHTSLAIAAVSGVVLAVFGYFSSPALMRWMGSPDNVIGPATVYMQIIFLGQPASLVYNFGAAILRSHGDTRRPMMILLTSGFLNVLMNLLFVIVFHLDAAGVALATVISQYLSAAAVLFILFHQSGEYDLNLKELNFDRKLTLDIVKIGVPAGINGMIFSLSNVIVVKALNSLGDVVLAANSAASNLDTILFQIIAAISTACISFAGQNYGARKLKRIDRLFGLGTLFTVAVVALVDTVIFLFPEFFLGFFTRDSAVLETGLPRVYIMGLGCLAYAIPEVALGCVRGMSRSVLPTVLNTFFICAPRIIWCLFVYPMKPDYVFLMLCFPLSYVLSAIAQSVYYLCVRISENKKLNLAS